MIPNIIRCDQSCVRALREDDPPEIKMARKA